MICTVSGGYPYASGMSEVIGYARCSLDEQDLTAQRGILAGLGVAEERIYLDHGLTGTNRERPGSTKPSQRSGPGHHGRPEAGPARPLGARCP